MEMYAPESPKAPTTTTQLRPGIFGKKKAVKPDGGVPAYFKELININSNAKVKKFAPVVSWRAYLKDLERTGTDQKIVERIRSQHEQWEAENPPRESTSGKDIINVPSDLSAVVVNLTVSKSGKVKVYTGAPMEQIHEKYLSRGTRAPIDVYLKALKRFGYPESVLMKVLDKHQKKAAKSPDAADAFIEAIFGKGGTKTSKPKARSVRDQLTTMLKIKRAKVTHHKVDEDVQGDEDENDE